MKYMITGLDETFHAQRDTFEWLLATFKEQHLWKGDEL